MLICVQAVVARLQHCGHVRSAMAVLVTDAHERIEPKLLAQISRFYVPLRAHGAAGRRAGA